MLKLKPLTENPFQQYPQLLTIWPEPSNSNMQEGYGLDIENSILQPEIDYGLMYLVCLGEEVVGLTGLFIEYGDGYSYPYNPELQSAYLRWHGIIPSLRGQGYAKEALTLMLREARFKYPSLTTLIELIPQTYYSESIVHFFRKMGFFAVGQSEKYDWSDYQWQPYHLNIDQYLNEENNKWYNNLGKMV